MKVSVAVSTFRRASLLPQLVAALEAQTLSKDDFEVVIVDNGSDDATFSRLTALAERTRLTLSVARIERNAGPASGRNRAWREARAPIVAFTDDDCMPAPDWLERGLAAMGEHRRIVVGRTIANPDQESRRGPFSLTTVVENATYFQTCNVFYRREDLEEANGFDEGFDQPGGEDTDLGWRVRDAGAEAVFAPDVLVLHEIHPSDVRAAIKRASRWTGLARVLRLHPDGRDLLHGGLFWKPSHPLVFGVLAAAILIRRRPSAAMLALPWVYYRAWKAPLTPLPRRRWLVLPGAFAVDLAEVIAMVHGSVKHGTIVL